MFYNTGIATYVWVLTNRKPNHRKGKVQLIDATSWFKPLRKNLGKKNCELTAGDIRRIVETFLTFEETEHSKIFPNATFGYKKITVERPLRLAVDLSEPALADFRKTCEGSGDGALAELVDTVAKKAGPGPHRDWGAFLEAVEGEARRAGVRLLDQRKKRDPKEEDVRATSGTTVCKRLRSLRYHDGTPKLLRVSRHRRGCPLPPQGDSEDDQKVQANAYNSDFLAAHTQGEDLP
jgi:type I restriction enzyme M protein